RIVEVIQETPDVKTFRLENAEGKVPPHRPGQFVKVCVTIDGRKVWRSFTVSSWSDRAEVIDLTIKRNPGGEVSNWLHDRIGLGDVVTIKGPHGGFFFDADRHTEPLVLLSAGSGITPMMSILRHLAATSNPRPCAFLHGARTAADVIFAEECRRIAETLPSVRYAVTLSQPPDHHSGLIGRLDIALVEQLVEGIPGNRYFLCGPGGFMATLREGLLAAGVSNDRIHTEQFHSTPKVVMT
ncbi:MAG: ferredoxin reductase, partial [Planctomycetaceae bacterium]